MTAYSGDPLAWMQSFMDEPIHLKLNRHAGQHLDPGTNRWVPDGQHIDLTPVANDTSGHAL